MSTSASPATFSKNKPEKLTSQQLYEWSSVGAIHKSELASVLRKIQRELRSSRSPAKTINKAIKNLEIFFARKEVRGGIEEKNHRKFQFLLSFPEQVGDDLCFCLIKGEISGRSGAILACEYKPILISFHALQRLFERLDAGSEEAVLDEIYSCLNWADAWNAGGKKSGAQSWPIPSTNGFFVATLRVDARSASTITWMRSDSLSKKWGVVNDNIIKLNSTYPDLMFDEDFLKEFIGSFPWMMHEHRPGVDFVKLAWASKDFELESEKETGPIEVEDLTSLLTDIDDHIQTGQIKVNHSEIEKISVSYITGLNYKERPPPFKAYSQHKGIVVQQLLSGALIVSLRNSWFGKISCINKENSESLAQSLKSLSVGDEIEVEVSRIWHSNEEKAYAISLDIKDLADANWAQIENRYPIGSKVNAETKSLIGTNVKARLEDRVFGFAPYNQVLLWIRTNADQSGDVLGKRIEFTVKNHNKSNRNLVLEIENLKINLAEILAKEIQNDTEVEGTVFKLTNSYALVLLDSGFSAMLHSLNCWGKQLPIIGDRVVTEVLNVDLETSTITIGFNPPEGMARGFSAIVPSDKKWELFEKNHFEGEIVQVQVREKVDYGFIVVMEDGTMGVLHRKEIDWLKDTEDAPTSLKIGDIIQVQIISIKSSAKRVFFSIKSLILHPLDDPKITIAVNECFIGVISKLVNYGYFVHLPFGTDGLIHNTSNPNSIVFSKGDTVHVYIKDIDRERRRIGLSLSPVDSEKSKTSTQ